MLIYPHYSNPSFSQQAYYNSSDISKIFAHYALGYIRIMLIKHEYFIGNVNISDIFECKPLRLCQGLPLVIASLYEKFYFLQEKGNASEALGLSE